VLAVKVAAHYETRSKGQKESLEGGSLEVISRGAVCRGYCNAPVGALDFDYCCLDFRCRKARKLRIGYVRLDENGCSSMGLVGWVVCETGIVPCYSKMGPTGEMSFTYEHNVYLVLSEEEF